MVSGVSGVSGDSTRPQLTDEFTTWIALTQLQLRLSHHVQAQVFRTFMARFTHIQPVNGKRPDTTIELTQHRSLSLSLSLM